ncbi:MAG: helix-turn-helix transcriptional regulator [Clostridia bacterium]|nr:helix-turn-helix transcriptional regulator [Clostridia bacterium]
MDIIKVFGTNVRKYRGEKNISQEKLAELSGLHRTYMLY